MIFTGPAHRAVKFVFALSRASNKKDGTLQELKLSKKELSSLLVFPAEFTQPKNIAFGLRVAE